MGVLCPYNIFSIFEFYNFTVNSILGFVTLFLKLEASYWLAPRSFQIVFHGLKYETFLNNDI